MLIEILNGNYFLKTFHICLYLVIANGCGSDESTIYNDIPDDSEEITISIKVNLAESSVKQFIVETDVKNKWLDIGYFLDGAETIYRLINPDNVLEVYPILRVEGIEKPIVSQDIQKVTVGEDSIWSFSIPRKTIGRTAYFELWDQDENLDDTLDGKSLSLTEGVEKFISNKSIEILKDHDFFSIGDDLLGRVQFTVENIDFKKEYILTKSYSNNSLKVIHKLLLDKNTFDIYIEKLIQRGIVTQDGNGNFQHQVGTIAVICYD